MAVLDSATLAIEAINEYLAAAELCLHHIIKPDGGCLGCPAALLLFCVTDAMGSYLESDEVVIEGQTCDMSRDPFRIFNHEQFGLMLTNKQIDLLRNSSRNKLIHNALIMAGTSLIANSSDAPFIFRSEKEVEINVVAFQRSVIEAWARFPKERIEAWVRRHPEHTGFTPIPNSTT